VHHCGLNCYTGTCESVCWFAGDFGPTATRGIFMALKAPGILTFMLSVILAVAVLIVKFFGASIPFVNGNEFWFLLLAHIILVFGCVMRGL
jgi:hypothetical protein